MTSTMRRTVRGMAAGLGALAIIAGASACGSLTGGGDEGDGSDEPAIEEPAEGEGSDKGDASNESAETDEGSDSEEAGDSEKGGDSEEEAAEGEDADADGTDGAASGEPIPEEELTLAGDRFFAFLEAMVAQDAEATCSLVIDHATGKPAVGAGFDDCVASFDTALGEELDPAMMDFLDRSMIEAVDNGDGRAQVTMMGEDSGLYMAQAQDGQWFVDADTAF